MFRVSHLNFRAAARKKEGLLERAFVLKSVRVASVSTAYLLLLIPEDHPLQAKLMDRNAVPIISSPPVIPIMPTYTYLPTHRSLFKTMGRLDHIDRKTYSIGYAGGLFPHRETRHDQR